MAVIFCKEFALDPLIEQDQPFFWEGVKDMMMYPVGFGAGALLWLTVFHL